MQKNNILLKDSRAEYFLNDFKYDDSESYLMTDEMKRLPLHKKEHIFKIYFLCIISDLFFREIDNKNF